MILSFMILPRQGDERPASSEECSACAATPDPSSALRFASFAPLRAVSLSEQEAAHVALRAACGSVGSHSIPRNVSPCGLFIQPTAQPPCCLVPGQRPLARVQVSASPHPLPATRHSLQLRSSLRRFRDRSTFNA